MTRSMRRRCRADNNKSELLKLIRKIPGVAVKDVSHVGGLGFDAIAGYKGRNLLLEIKNPKVDWKLEPGEEEMSTDWPGQWVVIETLEDFLDLIRKIR